MNKEICKIILGKKGKVFWWGRLVRKTIGNSHLVKFDGDWVLKREEEYGDVLGFYHTHLGTNLFPSEKDRKTTFAWVGCFNKPLLSIIEDRESTEAYLFDDIDGDRKRFVIIGWFIQIGPFLLGIE